MLCNVVCIYRYLPTNTSYDSLLSGLLLRHEDSWFNQDYFHIHHTASDTIDHVDKKKLEQNLAVLLGVTWILANSNEKLGRAEVVKK